MRLVLYVALRVALLVVLFVVLCKRVARKTTLFVEVNTAVQNLFQILPKEKSHAHLHAFASACGSARLHSFSHVFVRW